MIWRAVMGLVGVTLICASLLMTVSFAYTMAKGEAAYVFAAIAACVGIAKNQPSPV